MCELNTNTTTSVGAQRHLRRGEPICDECRTSRNRYGAERERRIRAGTWDVRPHTEGISEVLIDYLETFGAMTTAIVGRQLEERYKPATVRRTLYRLEKRGLVTKREDWQGHILWDAA